MYSTLNFIQLNPMAFNLCWSLVNVFQFSIPCNGTQLHSIFCVLVTCQSLPILNPLQWNPITFNLLCDVCICCMLQAPMIGFHAIFIKRTPTAWGKSSHSCLILHLVGSWNFLGSKSVHMNENLFLL
jgi:hypothetical protein